MAKHKQIWVAVILLLIAGFACQSQGVVSTPEPEQPTIAPREALEPVVEIHPTIEEINPASETRNIDAASSMDPHFVLGLTTEPTPTISPDTGQSGAELLQLGTLPLASTFNPPAGCNASANPDFDAAVLKLVNDERTRHGLSTLALHYQLSAAAMAHTMDMACNNFFSHTGSDGSNPFDRIKAQGYIYAYAGENLYAGNGMYNDPAQAVSGWMNSAGHRHNLLNPEFTEAGIFYIFNPNSTYGGYFAIVLARP